MRKLYRYGADVSTGLDSSAKSWGKRKFSEDSSSGEADYRKSQLETNEKL